VPAGQPVGQRVDAVHTGADRAGVQYEWDPAKAAANLRKHGIEFADAVTVSADPLAATTPDPTPDEGRLVTLGLDAEKCQPHKCAQCAKRGKGASSRGDAELSSVQFLRVLRIVAAPTRASGKSC
jgi:hypothetical protein